MLSLVYEQEVQNFVIQVNDLFDLPQNLVSSVISLIYKHYIACCDLNRLHAYK